MISASISITISDLVLNKTCSFTVRVGLCCLLNHNVSFTISTPMKYGRLCQGIDHLYQKVVQLDLVERSAL